MMLKTIVVFILCLVGSSIAADSTLPLEQNCAVDADGISEDDSCESPLAFNLLQVAASVPIAIHTHLANKSVVAFKEDLYAIAGVNLPTLLSASALGFVVLASVLMWLSVCSCSVVMWMSQKWNKTSKNTWIPLNMVELKRTLTHNISEASRAAPIATTRGFSGRQEHHWQRKLDTKQQRANRYSALHDMLKKPCMASITKEIYDFIEQFPSALDRTEAAARVHQFLNSTQESILSQSMQFMTESFEEQKMIVDEGLEKLIMCNLHHKTFGVDHIAGTEDERLRMRIQGLSWVAPSNLGIPPFDRSLLVLPSRELQRMDTFKAPKDKLICILNACYSLYEVLKVTNEEAHAQGSQPKSLSADDFLPLVIFVLIITNPPRLHSNLEFIATFRHPTRLVAEDAYFLTALQSAIQFVSEASPKQLDVSREEFDRLYAESIARCG